MSQIKTIHHNDIAGLAAGPGASRRDGLQQPPPPPPTRDPVWD